VGGGNTVDLNARLSVDYTIGGLGINRRKDLVDTRGFATWKGEHRKVGSSNKKEEAEAPHLGRSGSRKGIG